ncbi:MAG: biotin/lipoyl-containing protein [Vicinamibacterales bacterium]|nr:biotin/lipoyl-containing protein [Vicinamibacterales bacterium]
MEIRLEETTTRVTIGPDGQVEIADAAYVVTRVSSGIYRVTSGDRRWTVAVAGPADARWVSVNGRVAVVDTTPATSARRRTKSGGHDSTAAPMPATVVKILVEPGATVAKGDTLLVLEAMKMELPIRAPRDGVVKSIACQAGQLVQPGVNLLEFE